MGSRRRGAPQSEGRYSDQAWRCAYADGCTSLRRMKNQRLKWGCAEETPYAPVHGWAVPPPKLDGPLRKVAEREADDPEGNLTIVEWGVRKRQRCFSCREYGWGGSAHISEQHPILYGKAKQSLFGAFPGIFRRFASTAHNTPTQHPILYGKAIRSTAHPHNPPTQR